MICPQTKAECACNESGKDKTCPPPPTLAEIERLVDALEDTVRTDGYMGCERRLNREARAALMAAIQRYGRE